MTYSGGNFELDGWHLRYEAILRGSDSEFECDWLHFPQGGPRECILVRKLDAEMHSQPYWGLPEQRCGWKVPLCWNEYRPWEPQRYIEVPQKVIDCAHGMLLHHASEQYLGARCLQRTSGVRFRWTFQNEKTPASRSRRG